MDKEKLNTQLLLEIALNQNVEGDTRNVLASILPLYLRKLNCFAVAVRQNDRIIAIQPKALEQNESWINICGKLTGSHPDNQPATGSGAESAGRSLTDTRLRVSTESPTEKSSRSGMDPLTDTQLRTPTELMPDSGIVELEENGSFYYSYPLAQFGSLLLGKKNPLPTSLKYELRKIIHQLGKNLEHAGQEEEMRETRQKLESIFNEMTDVVWSVRLPDYKVLFITPSVNALSGIPAEKWIDDNTWWEKIIHEEDKWIIPGIYDQLQNEGYFNAKYRIVTPSGKIKHVRNKAKVLYDEQNVPVRIDGIIMDRTPRYEALEKLDQELKLQEILIDIASAYIDLDITDVENTINRSLEKMGRFVKADRAYIFDYDFDENTSSNTYEWCHEGIKPEIDNLQKIPVDFIPQWVEAHKQGEPFYVPDVLALEDDGEGGLRSILEPQGIKSLIAIPMTDRNDLVGFVGFDSVTDYHHYTDKEKRLLHLFGLMLINIRNRQKWENQLRLQEEKYRNIIANMNLGLLEVDNGGTVLFANQSFCEMSGYRLDELKGKNTNELLRTNEKRKLYAERKNGPENDQPESFEIQVLDKNGNRRWWYVSGAPNYNDRGQRTGSIDIHLDITEQKELEAELEKARNSAEIAARAKELFLANMSHEIRTPLNVIIGMIRELGKQNLGANQRFYVAQSDSAAKHLLAILNHILDMGKIESGELVLEETDFSLSAVASNAFSILHSQANEKISTSGSGLMIRCITHISAMRGACARC